MKMIKPDNERLLVLKSSSFAPSVREHVTSAGLSSQFFRRRDALFRALGRRFFPLVLAHWNAAKRGSFSLLRDIQRTEPTALIVVLAPGIGRESLASAYAAGAGICVSDPSKLSKALRRARTLRARLRSYEQVFSRLQSIHRTLRTLSQPAPVPESALSAIFQRFCAAVPCDAALLLSKRGNKFAVEASKGFDEPLRDFQLPRTVVRLLSGLVTGGKPRALQGELSFRRRSLPSALVIPLVVWGGEEHIIILQSRRADAYGQSEVGLASRLIQQSTVAASKILHYSELSRQAAQLASLLETGAEVSLVQELQDVLELAVAEAARLTTSRICTIRLIEGEYLSVGVAHGYRFPESRRHRIKIDERLSRIVRNLHPLIIPDLMEDTSLPDSRRERAAREGVRAFLGVPMICQGEAVGIFSLYKAKPHSWSDAEIALAKALAARTAMAIVNWCSSSTLRRTFPIRKETQGPVSRAS